MGTKNNPGNYDCYANAAPDEPMFILLGRDRHAASLVRLWALMRHDQGEDGAKVAEAMQCADAMDQWARGLGKNPVANAEPFNPLFEKATEGMDEHPAGWMEPCACDECCSRE